MSDSGMDRRRVLKLLVTLATGTVVAPQLWSQAVPQGVEGLEDVEFDALKDLAKAYTVFDAQDGPGVERMVDRLRGRDLANEDLVLGLRQEMREDFRHGRVANLHGWHVSRTEARVLAAAAKLLA